jgi:WD40 repeat protein
MRRFKGGGQVLRVFVLRGLLSSHPGITGLRFSHTGHAVYSASLDGTVRGYDLIRYRNFRTFTSPSPTQFSCVCDWVPNPQQPMRCAVPFAL